MADFNIRSESVDVEQIMKQIRSRIREKRGVDYTEEQVRELATVRLEKFLDPKNLRSDLLDQFRRSRPAVPSEPPPVEAPYTFSDETLFETHRGLLRLLRRLLKPILKLFFNPNPLINVLHAQAQFNVDLLKREQRRRIEFDRSRAEWNALYYEVLHNLVLETTRMGIEVKNLKMRVESLTSRLDFSERRVRALEGVVQYRPEAVRPRPATSAARPEQVEGGERASMREEPAALEAGAPVETREGPGAPPGSGEGGRRRRRRRRGRRGAGIQPGGPPQGATAPAGMTEPQPPQDDASFPGETDEDEGEGFEGGDEAAPEDASSGSEESREEAGFAPDSGPVPSPDSDPSTRDDDQQ